jgi:hypothetical protein
MLAIVLRRSPFGWGLFIYSFKLWDCDKCCFAVHASDTAQRADFTMC